MLEIWFQIEACLTREQGQRTCSCEVDSMHCRGWHVCGHAMHLKHHAKLAIALAAHGGMPANIVV